MAPYRPPTKVTTIERPWLSVVNQTDPESSFRKHREVEYDTSNGKVFVADPYNRGAYSRRSNVYAVGAPYGGPDAAITAALAPTVGVETPGLFEGVDDDNGWA